MSKYVTKGRKILISYLSQHTDEQLSVGQIASALVNDGISISAIYRNLADLEAEGKIRRCNVGGKREIFYQYTDSDCCRKCLHLCCKKCGKTFHMDLKNSETLIDSVSKSEKFTIDKSNTVLYGVCKNCKNDNLPI